MYPNPYGPPGVVQQTTTTAYNTGYPGAYPAQPYPSAYPGAYPGAYPAPSYGGGYPGAYGAPGYATQTTTGPYGMVQQTTTTSGGMFGWPSQWSNRYAYNYGGMGYSRHAAFMPPMGVSPMIASLFMQGSQIFRSADTNWSGSLDKREWKRAMRMLGITFSKHEAKHLFRIADTDFSGRISEREFCEFWVWMQNQRNPSMYPALW